MNAYKSEDMVQNCLHYQEDKMGKCIFRKAWLEEPKYQCFSETTSKYDFFCKTCNRRLTLGTMGVKALDTHLKSGKHENMEMRKKSSNSITNYGSHSVTVSVHTSVCLDNTAKTGRASSSTITVSTNDTLSAEILWAIKTVYAHNSYRSNDDIGQLFGMMFPDSQIAKQFSCGRDKTSYLIKFAVAPYAKKLLLGEIDDKNFVLMFDESLNKTTKNKQLDVHIRFWNNKDGQPQVVSRYLGSQFMGHASADDLLDHFNMATEQLMLKNLISVSMDGPNVNWKFLQNLQKQQSENYAGRSLLQVGSCGLHTIHNAFQAGFKMWEMDKILRALHFLFHNTPARREDYTAITGSSLFPLSFCGHRWVENLPVVQRAIQIWSDVQKYVEAVRTKKLPNPGSSSYDTIANACRDPLLIAKLHAFMSIANIVTPFLTKYQSDSPLLPFLHGDLTEMVKSLLRRYVKKEALLDISPSKLANFSPDDKEMWMNHKKTDVGLGAEAQIKSLLQQKLVSERKVMEFKEEYMTGMSKMIKKILHKSPLKYALVQKLNCLTPQMMCKCPEKSVRNMKQILHILVESNLVKSLTDADTALQEYQNFLEKEVKDERFVSFNTDTDRLDILLNSTMGKYKKIWHVVQQLLILSHGQAGVERGFSINKEVEISNMEEDTVVAHRLVCDYVMEAGGISKINVTKELLNLAATARTRYRQQLEDDRKKSMLTEVCKKRKAAEDEIANLQKRRKIMENLCAGLEADAHKMSEEAETKVGQKMVELITKSNSLRKKMREKKTEMNLITKSIEEHKDLLKKM